MPFPDDNPNDLPFPPFQIPELDEPIIAGDITINEGGIQESVTSDQAEPPAPIRLPKEIDEPKKAPEPIRRLMTNTQSLSILWSPLLLLPRDENRLSLSIYAASETATDFIRFADDNGKVQSLSGSAVLYSGQLLEFPVKYTGPVWVLAAEADGVTGPVRVSYIAVTY